MKKIFLIILSFFLTTPVYARALKNPLKGSEPEGIIAPSVIVGKVIGGVLGVIGTISLIIFIYGGVMILLSLGNDKEIQKGRDAIIWASVGLIIVFASYALAKYALNIALLA